MATGNGTGIRAPLSLTAALAGLSIALAGCTSGGARAPATTATAPNLQPDSRGVISYASYQVAVARDGDSIADIAARVGTTPEAIAGRNALPTDYRPRAGEVLLLPDSVPRLESGFSSGEVTTEEWSPERASEAITAGTTTSPQSAPLSGGQTDPLIDPVRHRVEKGETAYSIARLYGVSVTALASWNGLGPDLGVRTNQELLIPIVSGANRISGSTDSQPGEVTAIAPPPSASEPLPGNTSASGDPASPNLGQYLTPQGGRLTAPVAAGVTRKYNPSSPNGVGYAVPAGTPVKSAAPGEVALISEELGGLGTIVLIRHKDNLMTTYSTLSDVTVKKGDSVRAGQTIGVVAPRDNPELQFDVFTGTTAVDPTPYVGSGG